VTYQVDIEPINLDEAIRDVANIDRYVLDELERTMDRTVDNLVAAVSQRTPKNTGNLQQSWSKDVQRGVSAVRGEVATPVPYAPYVEKGRGPGGWPPRDAIEKWVERRLQITDEKEIRRAAFLIRRSIAEKGTFQNPQYPVPRMAEKGLDAYRGIMLRDFAAIPERVKQRVEQT